MKYKYKVTYQRQSDMVITWFFVDARYKEEALEIARKKLKGDNVLHAREV